MIANKIISRAFLVLAALALLFAGFAGRSESLAFWPGAFALSATGVLGLFAIGRGFHGRANLAAVILITLFAGWVVLRAFNTPVKYLARQDLVFCVAAFTAYALIAAQLETVARRRWIMGAVIALILANAAAGVWQCTRDAAFLPNSVIGSIWPAAGDFFGWTGMQRIPPNPGRPEMAGFFQSENHFAGFMAMAGLFCFGAGIFGIHRWRARLIYLIPAFIAFICVILSFSRAGIFALAGGVAVVLALRLICPPRGRSASPLALAAVFAGVFACAGAGYYLLQKAYKGGVFFGNEIKLRQNLARSAWEQFLMDPLDGGGARSYEWEDRARRDLSGEWLWFNPIDSDAVFAHNDWVQTLADYGIIGGGLAALALLWHFWSGWRFLRRHSKRQRDGEEPGEDERPGYVAGAFGAVAAVAAHCLIDFDIHIAADAVLAAVMLGFLANPGRTVLSSTNGAGAPSIPRRGIAIRVAVVLLAGLGSAYIFLEGPAWFRADRATRRGVVHSNPFNDRYSYFELTAALQEATIADPHHFKAFETWANASMEEATSIEVDRIAPGKNRDRASLMRLGFLRHAAEKFQAAWNVYPQNPYLAMQAAEALTDMRRFDDAEEWFQKAWPTGKSSRRLYTSYGNYLVEKGNASTNKKDAIELYQRALNDFYLRVRPRYDPGPDAEDLDIRIQNVQAGIEKLRKKLASPPSSPTPTSTPVPQPAPANP